MDNDNRIKCYSYLRVSTQIQVEGYSLDAQKQVIQDYADKENMVIVGEYVDAGKSGKNISGRPQFLAMMEDIQKNKDGVSYVLIFKLSRFGRNAADIMNSVQILEDNGVYLHSIEDYIDTGRGFASKLLISVLSAVAEVERENIRVQTLAGREQKAKEGKWNGGFAPYGYKLVDGQLEIADDEKEVIEKIFELYTTTNMGATSIAKWLNQRYTKKVRQNGTLSAFSATFVKKVIENPIYCGRLAYGRRRTEKIQGSHNEFHVVKQDEFQTYQGIHEGIISESVWERANDKKQENGCKREKVHALDHEHILSGILKCPICGSPMYGNVSRKKKADGTLYKDIFYYNCKRRKVYNGVLCDYRKNVNQEVLNAAVEEVIAGLVSNSTFAESIASTIGSHLDLSEIDKSVAEHEKRLRKIILNKEMILGKIESLDILDKAYEIKNNDLQTRLDALYEDIVAEQDAIEVLKGRKKILEDEKIAADTVYEILRNFTAHYKKYTDAEKKEFMNALVSEIQIYPEPTENGQILKSIKFKFPVLFGTDNPFEVDMSSLNGEKTVETVALLERKYPIDHIKVEIDIQPEYITSTGAANSFSKND